MDSKDDSAEEVVEDANPGVPEPGVHMRDFTSIDDSDAGQSQPFTKDFQAPPTSTLLLPPHSFSSYQ